MTLNTELFSLLSERSGWIYIDEAFRWMNFYFFLLSAKNSMRKTLSEVLRTDFSYTNVFKNVHVFMYFSTFFLEMSLFEWNSKIRVTLDICNSVTIWRNSKKLFSWHFKILLLEMENFTFDGCFLIKWIFRNSLIILEWF